MPDRQQAAAGYALRGLLATTDLALFIHDIVLLESDFADAQLHPFLEAFLLASEQSLPVLSFETDIPLRRLQNIAKNRDDVDEDELTPDRQGEEGRHCRR